MPLEMPGVVAPPMSGIEQITENRRITRDIEARRNAWMAAKSQLGPEQGFVWAYGPGGLGEDATGSGLLYQQKAMDVEKAKELIDAATAFLRMRELWATAKHAEQMRPLQRDSMQSLIDYRNQRAKTIGQPKFSDIAAQINLKRGVLNDQLRAVRRQIDLHMKTAMELNPNRTTNPMQDPDIRGAVGLERSLINQLDDLNKEAAAAAQQFGAAAATTPPPDDLYPGQNITTRPTVTTEKESQHWTWPQDFGR